MDVPKRQHYIPKFYLRGFADKKRRVRSYRRDDSKPFVASVVNVAVRSHFYTQADADGSARYQVESDLAQLEGMTADALHRVLKGGFPPNEHDRFTIALFVSTLMVRTPERRDRDQAVYLALRDFAAREGLDGEQIDELFEGSGLGEPNDREAVADLFPDARAVLPYVLDKSWILIRLQGASLITSDSPVIPYRDDKEANKRSGVGIANADQVYVPLDRRHLLVMVPAGSLRERAHRWGPAEALFVNHLVARRSYEWVFQHPDDPPLDSLMPRSRRPVVQLNDEDVYAP